MAFTLESYVKLRPFLYHVTARENLARLQRTRRLDTASALLQEAGREDLVRLRRQEAVQIMLGADIVVLKDQRPLVPTNVALAKNWEFADLVAYLNEHVYFWPGDALGLIAPGGRLLAHYAPESPLILRLPFEALLSANAGAVPLFSPYNSGALRKQGGKPVRRDADLFRVADRARGRPHEVVEVVFRGGLVLPPETSVPGEGESWIPLPAAA